MKAGLMNRKSGFIFLCESDYFPEGIAISKSLHIFSAMNSYISRII